LCTRLIYTGSGIHKRHPADYGFQPPCNPRPWKSLCDDLRTVRKAEARELFRQGILKGMVSQLSSDGVPKYVWSVAEDGEVFEAKIDRDGYHGYRLGDDDDMRNLVLNEWKRR
jgi:hypothetical protein